MTTIERSRRRVRLGASSLAVLALGGIATAVAINPYPATRTPPNPAVIALVHREKALAARATQVTTVNAQRWKTYRVSLKQRQAQIASVNAANAAAAAVAPSYSSGSSGGGGSASSVIYVQAAPVASTRTS